MKLTLSQRFKILFTGKMPEPQPTEPTEPPEVVSNTAPDVTLHRAAHTTVLHAEYEAIARKCRSNKETWYFAKKCDTIEAAMRAKGNIEKGRITAFRKPRNGYWEARIAEQQGLYIVQVLFRRNQQELKIK